jgi:hypothetical protein
MNIRLILLFLALGSFSLALSQDPGHLSKKEQKFADRVFEGETSAELLVIPDRDAAGKNLFLEGDRVYMLSRQDLVTGYLLSTRAMGRYDYFDYIIAYAPDLSVIDLSILIYRSDHGAAICQKGWLGQFKAYAGEELTLGKDIDAIAGATISATSIVRDMRRSYLLMVGLKEEGIIR